MTAFARLADRVARDGLAALVTVARVRGSAPREEGARLVLARDGGFHGTIGGGRLEWEALAAARDLLAGGRGPARRLTLHLGPDLGQCCGGEVALLLETFDARDAADLAALAGAEGQGGEAVCAMTPDGRVRRRATLSPTGRDPVPASMRGQGEGVAPSPDTGMPPRPERLRPPRPLSLGEEVARPPVAPDDRPSPQRGASCGAAWREALGHAPTPLLLFGAGHVGRALVLALAPLPFRVRWLDPRPDAFPVHLPANATPVHLSDPAAEVAGAPRGALVHVMTHSHALDLAVVAAALTRDDLVVGLIGSATKRARFERRLAAAGLPPGRIAALACPIGLPGIAGRQPAVIAASAAAQALLLRERGAAARMGAAA